jgi:hypothetical protein
LADRSQPIDAKKLLDQKENLWAIRSLMPGIGSASM